MGQCLACFNWCIPMHWELPFILVSFDTFKSNRRLYPVSLIMLVTFSLSHRLDPESHREGAPRAIELAAVNGHVDTFSMLAARLKMDSQNNEWFQLGQVGSLSSNHLLSLSSIRGAIKIIFRKNLGFWPNKGGGGLTEAQVFAEIFQNQICLGKWSEM